MREKADRTLPADYWADCRSDGSVVRHCDDAVSRRGESVAFLTGAGTTSGLWALSWPRWRSGRPDPHKSCGVQSAPLSKVGFRFPAWKGQNTVSGRPAPDQVKVSHEARYGSVMRRASVRKVDHDLVYVAPAPAFRRVIAFNDRMSGGLEVVSCMLVGRAVAAAHVAAGAAQPQVHPGRADLQALLAAERARRYVADPSLVPTNLGHTLPLKPPPKRPAS